MQTLPYQCCTEPRHRAPQLGQLAAAARTMKLALGSTSSQMTAHVQLTTPSLCCVRLSSHPQRGCLCLLLPEVIPHARMRLSPAQYHNPWQRGGVSVALRRMRVRVLRGRFQRVRHRNIDHNSSDSTAGGAPDDKGHLHRIAPLRSRPDRLRKGHSLLERLLRVEAVVERRSRRLDAVCRAALWVSAHKCFSTNAKTGMHGAQNSSGGAPRV